jgi:hypothetical protein
MRSAAQPEDQQAELPSLFRPQSGRLERKGERTSGCASRDRAVAGEAEPGTAELLTNLK